MRNPLIIFNKPACEVKIVILIDYGAKRWYLDEIFTNARINAYTQVFHKFRKAS